MASDEPLQRSWSSTCVFAPRMLRLVISAGSSDAVRLCKVAERQMLRPSSVPPRPLRQLRDPTRYRIDLVGARTAEKQRVEKLLEDACIKLSVVASDILSSGSPAGRHWLP
jgi:Transposase